jgi:cytochrome c biogenesis protein CcmG, thiol:disulfide interchange protein DsbE
MKRLLIWLPLLAFVGLIAVTFYGLFREDNSQIRSALVGQSLPAFELPPMLEGRPGLTQADFRRGEPRLLNVFGSWCIPCIAEAPVLMRLKEQGVAIDAVAIRDTPDAVRRFLDRHGDPYAAIGNDPQSRVQLSLGSSGVPETFVIDGEGRIAMQHIGPIAEEHLPRILKALEDAR